MDEIILEADPLIRSLNFVLTVQQVRDAGFVDIVPAIVKGQIACEPVVGYGG